MHLPKKNDFSTGWQYASSVPQLTGKLVSPHRGTTPAPVLIWAIGNLIFMTKGTQGKPRKHKNVWNKGNNIAVKQENRLGKKVTSAQNPVCMNMRGKKNDKILDCSNGEIFLTSAGKLCKGIVSRKRKHENII